jgi:hypothetical protein
MQLRKNTATQIGLASLRFGKYLGADFRRVLIWLV